MKKEKKRKEMGQPLFCHAFEFTSKMPCECQTGDRHEMRSTEMSMLLRMNASFLEEMHNFYQRNLLRCVHLVYKKRYHVIIKSNN